MSWQLYTIISVIALSLSVILQRVLIKKDKLDPVAYAAAFQVVVGLVICVVAFLKGFNLTGLSGVALPALASVFLYGARHIVYAKNLQKVEASAFSVLFATHAGWVMLIGLMVFGETLTLLQIVGAVLIFASVGLLATSFTKIFTEKGTLLGLLTGLLFGFAVVTWSYVGRHVDILS